MEKAKAAQNFGTSHLATPVFTQGGVSSQGFHGAVLYAGNTAAGTSYNAADVTAGMGVRS